MNPPTPPSSAPLPPGSPQVVYVTAPPPPRRSFLRAVFKSIAASAVVLSLILNVYLIAFVAIMHGGKSADQTTLEKGDPLNRIAVLSIDGVITDSTSEKFEKQLKQVEDDATFKSVVIRVDTPGGSVTASDMIYHAIVSYKARTSRPVVISQGGLATSGGYYISCAGDDVVAEPTTLTGNIGVLLERFNVYDLLQKWGVQETTLRSGGSPFKNAESMFKPETPEANAYLQKIVDGMYTQFRAVVSSGRAGKLKAPIEEVANGKVYSADQALALGLVDRIDYPDAAYAMAATRAGITRPSIVKIEDAPGLLKILSSQFGGGSPNASGSIQAGGIKVDATAVSELLSPKPLYLWEGR